MGPDPQPGRGGESQRPGRGGADLENARLSLAAQLTDNYIQLRSLDRTSAILDDTVKAYTRAFRLTQQRHDAGIAPGLDVSQAQTQLDAARSQAAQTLAQRALVEHAIAALLGISASTFSIKPAVIDIRLPHLPTGIPATVLQRRPDIAAAQRRMIAANANIGVARAAYFSHADVGRPGWLPEQFLRQLDQRTELVWAIGPNALLTVFDGGLHRAQVAQARAEFDASAANYRGVVIGAFQQVEDSLASLNHDYDAAQQEKAAVDSAQRTLDLSNVLYVPRRDRLPDGHHGADRPAANPAAGFEPRDPAAARQRRPHPGLGRRLGRDPRRRRELTPAMAPRSRWVQTRRMRLLKLPGHEKDLGGGFRVSRLLPAFARRTVGPFVLMDHFGPITLEPGMNTDVRPPSAYRTRHRHVPV